MKCEVCGNEYDKAFVVELGGQRHTFDSFECAIHALAPTCAHCGCHVMGHGVEQQGSIYCCATAPRSGQWNSKIGTKGTDDCARALVGESSEESFPASDPPAWAMGRD